MPDNQGGSMTHRSQAGWDRLQDLLERLTPGDEVRVSSAAADTGLDRDACAMVFAALTRAELFTQAAEDVFIRRRMSDPSQ
jgi:hypothetical protein